MSSNGKKVDTLGEEHAALEPFVARHNAVLGRLRLADGMVWASDGSILIGVPTVPINADELPAAMAVEPLPQPVTLDPTVFKALVGLLPKRSVLWVARRLTVDLTEAGGVRYHRMTDGKETDGPAQEKPADHRWALTAGVIPPRASNPLRVTLSAKRLAVLARYAQKVGGLGGDWPIMLYVDPARPLANVRFEFSLGSDGRRVVGTLAPMRLYSSDEPPDPLANEETAPTREKGEGP